eukprot:CAMPEP_0204822916 /NCGR_PEP_ID=MMETSP1346-20131115/1099_1 /ASSEMBLY_ACC=CAM_ASM_000771 /TAXON_ID=215587 /ORGANISM="Aplanochytrium stocchinoi, Strain GSBS06" /LENGTH=1318 /DNA_ID=CAMNT_0051949393 /DNA_START=205 /DNA_END=4161 /DNA_ORIENTATION=+
MPPVAPKTATLSNKKHKKTSRQKSKNSKNAQKAQLLAPPKAPLAVRSTSPISILACTVKSNSKEEKSKHIILINEETETRISDFDTDLVNSTNPNIKFSAPVPVPSSSTSSTVYCKTNDESESGLPDFSLRLNEREEDILLNNSRSVSLLDSSPSFSLSQSNSLSSTSFSTAASTSLTMSSALQSTESSDKQMDLNMNKFPLNVNTNVNACSPEKRETIAVDKKVTITNISDTTGVNGNCATGGKGNNNDRANSIDSETKSEQYFSSAESKESISPPWNAYEKHAQVPYVRKENETELEHEKTTRIVNVNKHNDANSQHVVLRSTGTDTDLLDLGTMGKSNDRVSDIHNLALMKTASVNTQISLDTNFTGQILNPVEVQQQQSIYDYNNENKIGLKHAGSGVAVGSSGSPRELSASPGTSSGLLSQLASRVPSNIQTSQLLPDLNLRLEGYVPEFIKDYTAGGADQRTDAMQRDKILWTYFQTYEQQQHLLIGYTDGFHIWDASEGTRVKEVASVRDGSAVRIVQYLAHPQPIVSNDYASTDGSDLDCARPLLAVCKAQISNSNPILGEDADHNGNNNTTILYIFSLALQRYIKEIRFKSKVLGVQSHEHAVVVALRTSIHGLCVRTLEKQFSMNCYPSPSESGVLALGARWLAYAGYQPVVGTPEDKDFPGKGGESNDSSDADRAWKNVTIAAKGLASGLSYLSDLGIQYVQNHVAIADNRPQQSQLMEGESFEDDIIRCKNIDEISKDMVKMHLTTKKRLEEMAGNVVVLDLSNSRNSVISNFRSHEVPIELMAFNPTGSLLVTTPVGGHTIHIHRIIPRKTFDNSGEFSTSSPQHASHKLLYSLKRGMTSASIRHIAFSDDLRWLCATSSRGTTHVYAISPTGREISAYSHSVIIVHKNKKDENNVNINKHNGEGTNTKRRGHSDTKWKDKVVSVLSQTIPVTLTGAGDNDLLPLTWQQNREVMSVPQSPGQRNVVPIFRPPQKDYLSSNEQREYPVNNLKLYALARVRQPVYMDATVKARADERFDSTDSVSLCSTPSRSSESSQKSTSRILEDIPAPVSAAFVKGAAQVVVTSSAGMLDKYDLVPLAAESDRRQLILRVIPNCSWDICRRSSWPELRTPVPALSTIINKKASVVDLSVHGTECDMRRANWLSNVEIQTHARPFLPIWASPQIRFMVYTPEEESKEHMPLFVDKIKAAQVEIRGEGPLPQQNNDNDMEELKFAIDTPAKFQNFKELSENEINETVLVYDDNDDDDDNDEQENEENENDSDEDIFSHDYEDDVDYEFFKNIDKNASFTGEELEVSTSDKKKAKDD